MRQYSAASLRSRKESAMSGQTANDSAVIPYAPKVSNAGTESDQLDRAGHAILGLVSRAADTTGADLRAAREAAEKLADQLRAANNQINELTANLRYYQDRTDRAEKWLYQISSEIEQRFFGTNDIRPARRNVMR
jgi:septal ring factor EnvC (AmiA/AmiB activator)